MNKLLLFLMLCCIVLSACVTDENTDYVRDGVRYGVTQGTFRGRWWSYYERGTSFLSGAFYAEAEKDFLRALSGRSRDAWQARTYGLHFAEYFPNRELGIVYYHQGRLAEAEQALQQSLDTVDTERAHYYLDEVKKAKIAQGLLTDKAAPKLDVRWASGKALSAERTVTMQVDAQDDIGVAQLQLNERVLHQRGSSETIATTQEWTFTEGVHEVAVTARDLAQQAVEQKLTVTVDLTGPTIGIFSPTLALVTKEDTVVLEGVALDANGVRSIRVDDTPVLESTEGKERVPFSHALSLISGENVFVITAEDSAGNETRSALHVFQGDPESPTARVWQWRECVPEQCHLASRTDLLSTVLAATPPEQNAEIRLKSPKPDQPYRHNRTLRIAGEVLSPTGITSLTINGEPFTTLTGAPRECFNRRVPLDTQQEEETVSVAIMAKTVDGATVEKAFSAPVRPVQLNTAASRMPVAVLAFAGHGVETEPATALRLETETQLVQQGRFRVLDRMRLQDVLTEQQLAGALADPNEAIALGKLTPAHIFLVADVFAREQHGLEIKARVISTETTEIMATLDAFVEDTRQQDKVAQACAGLAAQLQSRYPRLSGEILGVRTRGDTAEMLLNWSQEDGVQEGAYLLVVHEEAPWIDEETDEILAPGSFIEVGRAKITEVSKGTTRAQTVESKEEHIPVEKGMPTITM